ncbi:MAG: PAS domain-containing protein [Pseudomonadota bacterium]
MNDWIPFAALAGVAGASAWYQRRVRLAVQARHDALLRTPHDGIWMVDRAGRGTYASPRLLEMFACPDLAGCAVHDFLGENPAAELAALLTDDDAHAAIPRDLSFRRADGLQGWAIASGRPLRDAAGAVTGAMLTFTDISERKRRELALSKLGQELETRITVRTADLVRANDKLRAEIHVRQHAERALADSEERLHQIVTTMPVALFLKDADSRIVMMNTVCEEQWGVPFAEIAGTRGSAWFPPAQMKRFLADDARVFEGRKLQVYEELAYNSALAQDRRYQTYKKPVYDAAGKASLMICISIDITERKRTEDALADSFIQLRQLTSHLYTIKEEERKRIAQGIHDELGQNLMALKLDVSMLHARTGEQHPHLNRKVARVLDTLDTTITSVRAIINELHPSTLELGLAPAIEWLLAQFERRTGVKATLSVIGGDEEDPNLCHTAALFRVVQEALLNIVRHARARAVHVTLARAPGHVALTIADNGAGMEMAEADKACAFGLRGIRDRMDTLGGTLCIDSAPGSGTTLSLLIPTAQTTPA